MSQCSNLDLTFRSFPSRTESSNTKVPSPAPNFWERLKPKVQHLAHLLGGELSDLDAILCLPLNSYQHIPHIPIVSYTSIILQHDFGNHLAPRVVPLYTWQLARPPGSPLCRPRAPSAGYIAPAALVAQVSCFCNGRWLFTILHAWGSGLTDIRLLNYGTSLVVSLRSLFTDP